MQLRRQVLENVEGLGGCHSVKCTSSARCFEVQLTHQIPKDLKLDNGDVIDCVDFYSQPAMEDPYIRENSKMKARKAESKFHEPVNEKLGGVGPRRWSCPPGSVSFLKATKAGPLNYSALDSFTRSRAKFFSESNNIEPLDDPTQHEHALAHVDDGEYRGGQGTFNIWQPILEDRDEMSLMQIWVVRRTTISDTEANIETVEAGYMVQPSIFGDHSTRFFFFTTNNSYQTSLYGDTGKKPFRNNRLRFVRQSDDVPFGMELTPISSFDGDQGAADIKIQRNDAGDWELSVSESEVGFWPRSNYLDSFPFATMVRWGGEIVNHEKTGRHTSTQMGSGHFSSEGIGKAAYVIGMGLFDSQGRLYDAPNELNTFATNPMCYDVTLWKDDNLGSYITVGGPGYDREKCP
ncbi:uncharacterized protein LOC116259605 [Nymphaea colorata]|nr:uncharacterized protein LOC116259605 [Nymphaea colorata]